MSHFLSSTFTGHLNLKPGRHALRSIYAPLCSSIAAIDIVHLHNHTAAMTCPYARHPGFLLLLLSSLADVFLPILYIRSVI